MRDMVFKVDFLARFVTGLSWVVLEVYLINMIYDVSGVESIAGFGRYEILFVYILYQVIMSFSFIITPGMLIRLIFNQIHFGGLDMLILRPINTFWITIFQKMSLREFLPAFVYGFVFLPYILVKMELSWDINLLLQVGFVFFYSIVLVTVLYWVSIFIVFFIEKATFFVYFVDNLSGFGIYPRKLYPGWIQFAVMYVVPFFLVANPIYDVLEGSFSVGKFIQMLLMLILFIMILALEWRVGFRRYNSAV